LIARVAAGEVMTFLSPLILIALALVALPVAIHLLVRRRAKRLDFPSLRFLRETPTFKLRPRRVRQPVLLALRVLALLFLIAGLARPLVTYRGRTVLTRVILLDSSFSMRAAGRAEAAKQQARAIIERLGKGERAALIAFSAEAIVLAPPTSNRRQLEEALQRYAVNAAATNYDTGLVAAGALLAAEPPGPAEIDLISDFQESGLSLQPGMAGEKSFATIVTYPVGAVITHNTFLLDVSAARTVKGIELSAAEIVADENGRAGARRTWLLNTVQGEQPGIQWRTEGNGQIVGSISVPAKDDLETDNRHFFSFFPPVGGRVLLLGNEGADAEVYWQAALEAGAGKDHRFTVERRRDLHSIAPADYALVVATLSRSPDQNEIRRLVDFAEHGATIWLWAAPETDVKAWNDFARSDEGRELPFLSVGLPGGDAPVHFGAVDVGAAPLRSFDQNAFEALRTTSLKKAFTFVARTSASTLLRWDNGQAALVWRRVGAGQILVLGTSPGLEAGDLGLSPSFPVLVGSIADAAMSPREPLSRAIGEAVFPAGSPESVTITDPEGGVKNTTARDLAAHPQSVFSDPGIYRADVGGQTLFLAFNPPLEESNRLVASAEEIRDHFETAAQPSARSGSAWHDATELAGKQWRYFLGLGFLLLILELFLVMRRGRLMTGSSAM